MNKLFTITFRLSGSLLTFLLPLLVVKILGLPESNEFVIFLSLTMLFGVIANLGTNQLVLKFVPRGLSDYSLSQFQRDITKLFVKVFLLIFFITLVGYLFDYNFLYISIGLFLHSLIILVASFLQALNKNYSAILLQNILPPLFMLFFLLINYIGIDTRDYIIEFYILTQIFLLLIYSSYLMLKIKGTQRGDESVIRMNSFLLNIVVVVVFTQLVQLGAQFFSTVLLTEELSAKYILYQRISMAVSFFQMSINFVFLREFSLLYKDSKLEQLKISYQNSIYIGLLFSLPVFVFLLFYPELIMVFFGISIENAEVLNYLLIAQLIVVLAGPSGYLLTLTDFEATFRKVVLCSGSTALIITPIFIYCWGIYGASLSTLIAISVHIFLTAVAVNKKLGFFGFITLRKFVWS